MSTLPALWKPTFPNQVIGESEADGAFIKAIASAHGVPAFDFTAPKGKDNRSLGKDGFARQLVALRFFITQKSVSRVVLVGDNDTDHAAALIAVRRAIKEAKGYPTPNPPSVDI